MWVANNGADDSTFYAGAQGFLPPVMAPLVVGIPGGAPTGTVYNPTGSFAVHAGKASGRAWFLFDSEAGQITGWSPFVAPQTSAQTAVTSPGAIYKGLTLATTDQGPLLYAADFHNARIDVFDGKFAPVQLPGTPFIDGQLPAGYAPFNVENIGGMIVVAYAKQDADAEDEVAGPGLGYVDIYDPMGKLVKRLAGGGPLNAPWGLVQTPAGFGGVGGDLLVGNFGDGMINAYNMQTGKYDGQLVNEDHNPIQIDGLWALRFGNGIFAGARTLVFTAGIADESHGLLGTIVPGRG
jgi:uncharacterized protein (TIGR03118 family)